MTHKPAQINDRLHPQTQEPGMHNFGAGPKWPRQYARINLWALLALLVCALPFGGIVTTIEASDTFASAKVSVHFSPKGGATETVVQEIGNAQSQILVQAYSFTSAPIAKALIDATKRGIKIRAVLDKSNETEKYSAATFLVNAGIETQIDDCQVLPPLLHSIPPPQSQCVTGDTYVYTSAGMQKIEDLITEAGYYPATIDLLSVENTFQHTSYFYKNMVREVVTLTTTLGKKFTCTPEHPLQVVRPDLAFHMAKAGTLQRGDRLVVKVGHDQAFAQEPFSLRDFCYTPKTTTVTCRVCDIEMQNLSSHMEEKDKLEVMKHLKALCAAPGAGACGRIVVGAGESKEHVAQQQIVNVA
jgi:hypothetical protein